MKGRLRPSSFLEDVECLLDDLKLNERNIPFVNSVKYLGVIFVRRMTWRLHIEKIAAKAMGTYIRTYSVFKSILAQTLN
jgi:hypothetical protein